MIFNVGVSAPRFPVFSFTVGSNVHRFGGTNIDNSDIKVNLDTDNFVKIWFKNSGTLRFDLLVNPADICAVGKGGSSGAGRGQGGGGEWHLSGGGGAGGEIKTELAKTLRTLTDYVVSVGETNSIVGSDLNISAAKGQDGTAGYIGSGGSIHNGVGGTAFDGRKGGNGVSRYNSDGSNGKDGDDGLYAFDITFDGIRYAPCGGSGGVASKADGSTGADADARGAGGRSAHCSGGATNFPAVAGAPGIVLMRIPLL